jgi:transcriptional regulator with XRE-family HTH domain
MKHFRAIVGLTQKQLADLTDTSEAYIAHIEAGRANMSYDFVQRIKAATGVRFRQKGTVLTIDLHDWLGRKYSKASFEEWRNASFDTGDAEKRIKAAKHCCEAFIRRAFNAGVGMLVVHELAEAFEYARVLTNNNKAPTADEDDDALRASIRLVMPPGVDDDKTALEYWTIARP